MSGPWSRRPGIRGRRRGTAGLGGRPRPRTVRSCPRSLSRHSLPAERHPRPITEDSHELLLHLEGYGIWMELPTYVLLSARSDGRAELVVRVQGAHEAGGMVDVGLRPDGSLPVRTVVLGQFDEPIAHEEAVAGRREVHVAGIGRRDDGLAQIHGLRQREPETLRAVQRHIAIAQAEQVVDLPAP